MGYINYANLYFSIIGSRGDIKSPAMDLATFPLVKYDNEKYKEDLSYYQADLNFKLGNFEKTGS